MAGNRGAQTRIDWAETSLVREPIDEVVALAKAELPSLAVVTAPDGTRIWFDAPRNERTPWTLSRAPPADRD